jgi:hypothetical protein
MRRCLRAGEAVAWWYIAMDNAARMQLLAEAAGQPKPIPHDIAKLTASQIGTHKGGYFSFPPLSAKLRRTAFSLRA